MTDTYSVDTLAGQCWNTVTVSIYENKKVHQKVPKVKKGVLKAGIEPRMVT